MERRSVVILSVVAFAVALLTDLAYIALINSQGQSNQPYIPRFVGSYLAVLAAMIAVSLWPRSEVVPMRIPLRAAAAGGLLILGIITSYSVGPPLVVAGVLMTFVLRATAREVRSRPARFSGLIAAALSVAVLLAGLEVSARTIVCLPGSNDVGGGSTLILGSYQYQCVKGQVHFYSS